MEGEKGWFWVLKPHVIPNSFGIPVGYRREFRLYGGGGRVVEVMVVDSDGVKHESFERGGVTEAAIFDWLAECICEVREELDNL